jgi:hypothetical protein
VRGGYLAADSGLALWHNRITEAGNEHAFGQEQVAHPDRGSGLTQDDGYDRGFTRKRLEAEA